MFFDIFVLIEFLLIVAGEAMADVVFDDTSGIYAGLMVAVSAFSMLLVLKDKTVACLVLALSVTPTLTVYLGHSMLRRPCRH